MPVSQRTAAALRTCIGMAMAAAAIGASYAAMIGGQPKLGATVGLFIGSGVSALEVFIVQTSGRRAPASHEATVLHRHHDSFMDAES